MELFTVIDDATAILRGSGGVYKQAKVYQRGGKVYVGHAGGFLRVCSRFDSTWGTSAPGVKVIDIEGAGVDLGKGNVEPRYAS